MKKLKLTIDGMHCASCSSNLERSISSIKNVKEVSANALTGNCFVSFDGELSKDELKKAVSKPGFELIDVEVE